ncbi:MAG: hypothetical protein AAF696_35705 [Bacteroidota bacterium]
MKTSGSKRDWGYSPDYADTRNAKQRQSLEDLPKFESIGKSWPSISGKLNTDLLKRFLRTQGGKDWDEVYSEYISRVPSKLYDKKACIQWYVADKVEFREGKLVNLRDNYFIATETDSPYYFRRRYRRLEFYVDPDTNKLMRIGDFKSRRKTRDLDRTDLRKFREAQQKQKRRQKRSKAKKEAEAKRLEKLLKARKLKDRVEGKISSC